METFVQPKITGYRQLGEAEVDDLHPVGEGHQLQVRPRDRAVLER